MSAQYRVMSRCDVPHCGWEELHHFLPVLLQGMLPLFSIITLWPYSLVCHERMTFESPLKRPVHFGKIVDENSKLNNEMSEFGIAL